jgi:dTDP-glucose 4,6-dehydratase
MKKILVTGGFGFIGSNFINLLSEEHEVFNIDKLSYASDVSFIKSDKVTNFVFDLEDLSKVQSVFNNHGPFDTIFHFAAESHVDNSIANPIAFTLANIVGTHNLVECFRLQKHGKFVHVSTDEVYGHLELSDPSFTEETPLAPRSPYSASKASSDLIVKSYFETFGCNINITRCCNNFGKHQHVEKLIPKTITNILQDNKVPLYGKGNNIREWILVGDHCKAIYEVGLKGRSGEVYNIGSGVELTNYQIIEKICNILGKKIEDVIEYVEDRKGHDFRYSINSSKTQKELGWKADCFDESTFETYLAQTIEWYKNLTNN